MFGFFDTLFKWFNRDQDEENPNSEPIDIFADQKKVQFNFMTERDRKALHQYVTRETQTDISIRRETKSCEVMTEKVDFPLSSFDTETVKKTKEAKHFKYGPQTPIKMNKNFKFEFTFHNIDKTSTIQKRQKSINDLNDYEQETTKADNKTETEDQPETENQLKTNNLSETENQSETNNQSETENISETENQPEPEIKSETEELRETDNQSDTTNQTEYDDNSGYDNTTEIEEEEEEAEYDSQS